VGSQRGPPAGDGRLDPQWLRRYNFSSTLLERIRAFLWDGLFRSTFKPTAAGRNLLKAEALDLLFELEFETRYLIELDVQVFLAPLR